jgi:hypothetical protein
MAFSSELYCSYVTQFVCDLVKEIQFVKTGCTLYSRNSSLCKKTQVLLLTGVHERFTI